MADDLSKTGKGDDSRINVTQDHELSYWTKKLNVNPQRLKDAVKAVGPILKDVEK